MRVVSASSNSAREAKHSAFCVESPRASDAIGKALRDVYGRDSGLPEDMIAMLARLNDNDSHARCAPSRFQKGAISDRG